MHTKALPYVGLLGLLWGTNLVIMRIGVGQFDPMVFVGIRLLMASLAFVAVYTFSGRRIIPTDRKLWLYATFLGIVSTAIPMTAVVTSLTFQSSGVTALLITTAPAYISIAAHFFLPDERMTPRKVLGVLLALSGAALIVLRGESGLPDVSQGNPIGYVLVIAAMLFETAGTILIRRHMQDFSSFDVTAVRLTVAGLTVLPVAILLRGIEQLANGEVARRLELSDSAVTRRFQAALQQLREALPDSVFDEIDCSSCSKPFRTPMFAL